MGARQKRWARKARAELMQKHGDRCAHCGVFSWATDEAKPLEFHCISPRGDAHHRLDFERRTSFYRREHEAGNLLLLCQPCHAKEHQRMEREPF